MIETELLPDMEAEIRRLRAALYDCRIHARAALMLQDENDDPLIMDHVEAIYRRATACEAMKGGSDA